MFPLCNMTFLSYVCFRSKLKRKWLFQMDKAPKAGADPTVVLYDVRYKDNKGGKHCKLTQVFAVKQDRNSLGISFKLNTRHRFLHSSRFMKYNKTLSYQPTAVTVKGQDGTEKRLPCIYLCFAKLWQYLHNNPCWSMNIFESASHVSDCYPRFNCTELTNCKLNWIAVIQIY